MSTPQLTPAFSLQRFVIRRKLISLLGLTFYFEDEMGNQFAYVKRKALTWRENIRVYTDESMTTEVLRINARNIIDFAAAFDVEDATTGQIVGSFKRRGFKSLLKDEWKIMTTGDVEVGRIVEDSMFKALLRRFVFNLLPQTFNFEINGQLVGTASQNWNLFAPRLYVDFTNNNGGQFDPRMALAGAVLLIAIEGRQKDEEQGIDINIR